MEMVSSLKSVDPEAANPNTNMSDGSVNSFGKKVFQLKSASLVPRKKSSNSSITPIMS